MKRALWWFTGLMVAIAIAIVTRRMAALAAHSASELDAGFARHAVLTMAHILPGLLFMLLAPLQFVRGLRSRRPVLHRWMGRVVLASGVAIGATALAMSPQMAIGGAVESAATTAFGIVFLVALAKGFLAIRRGNVALHREWMIRTFAIGSAVTTTRPIVGLFFATSRLTHWTPHDFFGAAFWMGFTLQTAAAEMWIRYTRPAIAPAARDTAPPPESRDRNSAGETFRWARADYRPAGRSPS